jgi:predicted lipoprotein with Yx(FWY)xxD motif
MSVMIAQRFRGCLAIGVLVLVLAACSNPTATTPASSPASSSASAGTPTATGGAVTLKITSGALGNYLTDSSGRTVYMFAADIGGTPTCYAECATFWPPLTSTAAPIAGEGVDAGLLKTVTRTDGAAQVVYGEYPLYYFAKDSTAGETLGQGSNGSGAVWWVLGADGEPITTALTSSVEVPNPEIPDGY